MKKMKVESLKTSLFSSVPALFVFGNEEKGMESKKEMRRKREEGMKEKQKEEMSFLGKLLRENLD
ncbi:hypothetical protein [Anaerocolumna xylanovorans]|uniref:hypothetical protein n=1 Tax=Anaerocolumna xylanovorans TaxID=100134 RepID=UPI000935E2E6|nr:hypothetical protein [Anaerocolumna xylanovorans]